VQVPACEELHLSRLLLAEVPEVPVPDVPGVPEVPDEVPVPDVPLDELVVLLEHAAARTSTAPVKTVPTTIAVDAIISS
jgi:hypothetical protein